ncbi:DUF4249 domain-containing protein [Spongiivirga sp. MCCC 1A20706]|uniref:DUF4249 domain-containing protein n=1 Tax=Spongiivirga sp. MCCC 1A20706 TaxID=3160963 RepID=UPI003977611C
MKDLQHKYLLLLYLSKTKIVLSLLLCLFITNACIEPFEEAEFVEGFEDILVVNATITNEQKRQEVILNRSFEFGEEDIPTEEGAEVFISDESGNELTFSEVTPGRYISDIAFAAEMGKEYVLNIVTSQGQAYRSSAMQLPTETTTIDRLYVERFINNDGIDGLGIFIDSFDSNNSSKFYRHEYVENFKIIAPFWSPFDAVVVTEGISTFDIRAILREQEERVCYGENLSKDIILNSTLNLSEDRLDRAMVRFIDSDDYVLTHRYSILIKQFVQSPEAFSYYETLKGLSQTSGNVFSEDQPGFLQGNVSSVQNPNENVAGFFEIVASDEKRIFFNYEDYFPGEELPPYFADCVISAPLTEGSLGERELLNLIYDDVLRFYDFNNGVMPGGPFLMVRKECGDCTTLGSNKIPDFWIE